MLPALLRSYIAPSQGLNVSNPDLSDDESDAGLALDSTPVLTLPPKVFAHILRFLSGRDSIAFVVSSFAVAEKAVPALLHNPPLLSQTAFAKLVRTLAASAAPDSDTVFEYHPLVEELVLEGPAADSVEMGDLETAFGLCPNLRAFRLEGCLHVSSKIVQSLADYVPNLRVLSLAGCPVGDGYIGDLVKGCPSLTHVNLSGTNVSFASFDPLLVGLRSLESLLLDGMQPAETEDENPRPRRSSFIASPPTTRKSTFTPKGPTALNLKVVSLNNSSPLATDLKRLATRAPHIVSLSLAGCDSLTNEHVITFLDTLAANPSSVRLQSLDLDGCPLLTSLTATRIAETFAGIPKGYTAPPPTHSNPTNMLDLIDPLGRLKFMTVSPLQNIGLSETDISAAAIRTLVRECGALTELRLDGCDSVTATFIEEVAQDCWVVFQKEQERLFPPEPPSIPQQQSPPDMSRKGSRLPIPVKKPALTSPPLSPPPNVPVSTMPRGWCRLIGAAAIKRVANYEGAL
ncbi:RNI-like protein [Rhizoclosmatium globosum]|uniref:RNI-like protein n=1 Tax=Rhizoclosmatium globosum TaxID=329046 RepID=A0A1Y2CWF4_9FUNG|nr:RNI-like protein [Rhizoclosmatium globosum]|eukprot:ORY51348.1 RNI-like protein [Rhizoclosmatium globosum]